MTVKNKLIEQLRGMAVLFVIFYHYTMRIPFEAMGSTVPPSLESCLGKLGVYIFFSISGYLIAKTIQQCPSLDTFYARRLSRIWPLFIAASFFVFVWGQFLPPPYIEGNFDAHGRDVWDVIGTSFFLKDFGFSWIDGAYWSILVELKFYLFFALCVAFFKKNGSRAFIGLSVFLGLVEFGSYLISGNYTSFNRFLHGVLIAQYMPFFALGVALFAKEKRQLIIPCFVLCLAQIVQGIGTNPVFSVSNAAQSLFLMASLWIIDHLCFKKRMFLFLGRYSYALYLFHQVIGLSIILKLTPRIGIDAAIIIAFLFVVMLSVATSWLIEWRARNRVTSVLIKIMSLIGLNRIKLKEDAR